MTYKEAQEDIPNFDMFYKSACDNCASNDWYCPTPCSLLEQAKVIPFEKIQKSHARNDGDLQKVFRYIKRYNA